MADKLSQKVILALEIVRLLVLMKLGKEINAMVWRFFCMAGASKLQGMGSESNISILGCLIGEEEQLRWLADGIFVEPCCGVLTWSAFMVLTPQRLMLWTSLSFCTVPFGFILFGLEENDMMREVRQTISQIGRPLGSK